jgi:hypothetical protein
VRWSVFYHKVQHSQTLRPAHSVFVCFGWFSEQTAIIFLCSIKWLVFITGCWPLYRGCPGSILGLSVWDLWWIKRHWDRFFSEYFCCPSSLSFRQSFTRCCYQKDKRAKLEDFPKSNTFPEIGEHWLETSFYFFQVFKADTEAAWPLQVSDYVKDWNCFQWKWREFLEKVWPWACGIMLQCAMGSGKATLSVIRLFIASFKGTQKRMWFVALSSVANCGIWFYVLTDVKLLFHCKRSHWLGAGL